MVGISCLNASETILRVMLSSAFYNISTNIVFLCQDIVSRNANINRYVLKYNTIIKPLMNIIIFLTFALIISVIFTRISDYRSKNPG
ncbi:hypothetical protein [Salmon gill poxvirus]